MNSYKVGSNQYQTRRKTTLEGMCAVIIFTLLLVYVVSARTVNAVEEVSITPTPPKTEYAKIVEVTPTPSKVDAFMQKQIEINQTVLKWMKTQEVINSALVK